MRQIFAIGDKKTHIFVVKQADVATFETGVVHHVCSTFALAREMEWSSRLFVLEMKEDEEEGIGTMLTIDHQSPAMVGDQVEIVASVVSIIAYELICNIRVTVGDRLIAEGQTGQKILKKAKIEQVFASIK